MSEKHHCTHVAEPLALAALSDAALSSVATVAANANCCAAGESRLRLPPLLLRCTTVGTAAAVVLLSSLSLAAVVTACCDADCSGALLSLLLLRADVGREALLRGALM
jgi:hypothetical protein